MNSKIKQLAEEAGFVLWGEEIWNPGDAIDWSCDYDKELIKFVELIVKECAGVAHGSDTPSKDIKEHFGVE